MDGRGGKCEVRGTGACALREARQLAAIEAALGKRPMTVAELAPVIGVSPDTVRSRIRTLVDSGRPVRVVDWRVLPTAMVRVWGVGAGRAAPRPARPQRSGDAGGCAGKGRRDGGSGVSVGERPVCFRRDGLDEWLFRIRGLRGSS